MNSFSSRQARLESDPSAFAAWAPEAVREKSRSYAPPRIFEAADVEDAVEAAVAEAVANEQAAAAQREAELRAEFELQLEATRDEALQRGREEGESEGRTEGERGEGARLRTAVSATEEALDALRAGEMRWTGAIEENVCALAVVIARQVIGRELKVDIEPVADLVRGALESFPIDQPIRIRINPGDLNALGSVGVDTGDPLQKITRDHEARWLADATIAPGGCVVEGRERIIDGRVDTALERVYRRLTYTNA